MLTGCREEVEEAEEAKGDKDENGADRAGDGADKLLDEPWAWPVMDWLTQRKDCSQEILDMNNVRVVPHAADASWAEEWKGAYVYDGIHGQDVPAETMAQFEDFYKAPSVVPPPCRNKVSEPDGVLRLLLPQPRLGINR